MNPHDHINLRRRLLLAGAVALPFSASAADAILERPTKLVVSFPAGGAADVIARELALGLKEIWRQPVIIDNKPGAAGVIAAETTVRAAPDGTTLFVTTDGAVTGVPFIGDKVPYDPLKDLKPIAIVGGLPLVLVVNPSLGVKTVKEFIDLARSKPGGIDYASGGTGASHHLSMEALQRVAGIRLNHIPYKGGAPALVDVVAGHVPVMWVALSTGMANIQAKKVIPLGLGSLQRSALLPDLPTMDESGYPRFEAGNWVGVMGPAGMPDALVARIAADLRTVSNSAAYRSALGRQGNESSYTGTAEFAQRVRVELDQNKVLAKKLSGERN